MRRWRRALLIGGAAACLATVLGYEAAVRRVLEWAPSLIVLGVIFAFLVYRPRFGSSRFKPSSVGRADARSRRGLLALATRDPGFDAQRFTERVESAFAALAEARGEHDLGALANLVSDGVLERLAREIEAERERGERRALRWVDLDEVSVDEAHADDHFDVLTARIRGHVCHARLSVTDGRALDEHERSGEPLDVCWTFLRRQGVKTREGGGLFEGQCPNCRAPVATPGASARCAACRSWLRSPEYDWVLSKVSDRCDWRNSAGEQTPGTLAIREGDPDFNLWHLEDRASVLFWRWLEAQRGGEVEPLRSMASRSFRDDQRARFARPDRLRWVLPRVGGLHTLGFLGDATSELAVVELRWSATEDVAAREADPNFSYLRHLLVLRRRKGARTHLPTTLSSSHCPGCGAPEESSLEDACRYCGALLGEAGEEWILDAMYPRGSAEANSMLRAIPRRPPGAGEAPRAGSLSGTALFGWVVHAALADGSVADVDRRVLERLAEHCEIPRSRARSLVAAARSGRLDVAEPADRAEAEQWLRLLVDLALRDGEVDYEEVQFIESFGRREPRLPGVYGVRLVIRRHLARRRVEASRREAARG